MDIPLSSDCPIQQLLQVDGDRSQKNDVLFCGPIKPAIQNVVFFGGDVQVRPGKKAFSIMNI